MSDLIYQCHKTKLTITAKYEVCLQLLVKYGKENPKKCKKSIHKLLVYFKIIIKTTKINIDTYHHYPSQKVSFARICMG